MNFSKLTVFSFLIIGFVSTMTLARGITKEEWGGKHVSLSVSGKKANFEFDCAAGSASPWKLVKGKAKATGTLTHGTGMRPLPGHEPKPVPATYEAVLRDGILELDVTADRGTSHYQLLKDAKPELFRCL